jgi:hypothetical protein
VLKFEEFPKISRLARAVVVTEKIDGTNAQIHIYSSAEYSPQQAVGEERCPPIIAVKDGLIMSAASRSRYLTPGGNGIKADDNFGFAGWVKANADDLWSLGPGRHFGEWWGSGIQRGYGLPAGEKRFSLFNVSKWADGMVRPSCCAVVPTLGQFEFDTHRIDEVLRALAEGGSRAAPGFMKPEGIIVFHAASGSLFKKTIERDSEPKSKAIA